MQEQELTLFGGWAKAQIPQQIELGVVKRSGTPSVSISFENGDEHPIEIERILHFIFIPHITIEELNSIPEVIMARWTIPYTYDDSGHKRAGKEQEEMLHPKSWHRAFIWFDKAFLRFFEIWEHGTQATIIRGLAGTDKMRKSLSGVIGGNYNGGFKDSNKPLTKLPNGEWTLSNTRSLYPDIPRLPKEGIINARKLAKQLQQKRINTSRKIES